LKSQFTEIVVETHVHFLKVGKVAWDTCTWSLPSEMEGKWCRRLCPCYSKY